MSTTNWDLVIDRLQTMLVWFIVIVVVSCTVALILFDVFVGAGTMYFLTQKNVSASIAISMATTGLLMALLFIGYNLSQNKANTVKNMGYGVAIVAFGIYCLDVYFDSLTADILRFGSITSTHDVTHNLFRVLLGGISTIGEPMAIAIILGMPVLKSVINNAIPESYRRYQPATPKRTYEQTVRTVPEAIRVEQQKYRPAPRPERVSNSQPAYHPVVQILEEETEGEA